MLNQLDANRQINWAGQVGYWDRIFEISKNLSGERNEAI
jgi:hypothetical protein